MRLLQGQLEVRPPQAVLDFLGGPFSSCAASGIVLRANYGDAVGHEETASKLSASHVHRYTDMCRHKHMCPFWFHVCLSVFCMYVMYVMYVMYAMYVCMYICMYVCMYVCMYLCIYVRMYVSRHMYVRRYVRTHVRTHVRLYPCRHVCACLLYGCVYVQNCVYTYTYMHRCMLVYKRWQRQKPSPDPGRPTAPARKTTPPPHHPHFPPTKNTHTHTHLIICGFHSRSASRPANSFLMQVSHLSAALRLVCVGINSIAVSLKYPKRL